MSAERAKTSGGTGARAIVATVALVLCAAPTAGDIGSCGQEVAELDAQKFFQEKQVIDCGKCQGCAFVTAACQAACTLPLEQDSFPELCAPLVHDGEVCLNALRAAGCGEYAAYVDDLAPTIPTECNFCPLDPLDQGTAEGP